MDRIQLSRLVEATGGDMRQCLNKLQIVATGASANSNIAAFAMDEYLSQTGFEAAKQLLVGTKKYSFMDRYSMFFSDYELTPLVVEQNYLDSIKSNHYSEQKVVEAMAEAADGMCSVELLHDRMIRENVSMRVISDE